MDVRQEVSFTAVDAPIIGRDVPTLVVVSAWIGAGLVLVTAVTHIFSFPDSGSAANSLGQSAQFLLSALILASLAYLAWRSGEGLSVAALPLLINLSTLIIVNLVPFASLGQTLRFHWYAPAYTAVVRLVESGELTSDSTGFASLPPAYRHLSTGGRIMVQHTPERITLFFFTRRFSATAFAGYMYRSDPSVPRSGDFGGSWQELRPERPYWFYCLSD